MRQAKNEYCENEIRENEIRYALGHGFLLFHGSMQRKIFIQKPKQFCKDNQAERRVG